MLTSIENELKSNYLLYSCSIFNRALPHVVDGLKTAQRRIILGMIDLGLTPGGTFKKVSRLEGHVLGSYHPQGGCASTAIGMGMANGFRYPLTNIHGNVGGSVQSGAGIGKTLSEDNPAAARYLEVKFSEIAWSLFKTSPDLEWIPNYDASTSEVINFVPPIPNLLINGGSGIAAGFACNHAPYNIKDVVKVVKAYIKNKNLTPLQAAKILVAPDFPNGAKILHDDAVTSAITHGHGGIKLFGEWHFSEVDWGKRSKRDAVIITNLASGSSEKFLEKIKSAVDSEKINSVIDVRDLSTREGIEIMVVLKPNSSRDDVISQLLAYTNLYDTFSVNATAVGVGSFPQQLGVVDIIKHWYDARKAHLNKVFNRELQDNLKKLEVLEGLLIVVDNLDAAIKIIRNSTTTNEAKEQLIKKFKLTSSQVLAVLNLTLSALVKTEKNKLLLTKSELESRNIELNNLIQSESSMDSYIVSELGCVQTDSRRCEIIKSAPAAIVKSASQPKQLTTIEFIKKDARSNKVPRKEVKLFLESAQKSELKGPVKLEWEKFKQKYFEFKTPNGKRARREELSKIKSYAYSKGMPKRGKNSWTSWLESHSDLTISELKARLEEKLNEK